MYKISFSFFSFFVCVCVFVFFCFPLPPTHWPQPALYLQFDALDGVGWRVSLPVSSREHPGLPTLSRWHRFAASPSSYLLWPPGGRMSLCTCQLPHCQWRRVSWVNEGSPRSLVVKLERFCVTPTQSRWVNLATRCPYVWLYSALAFSLRIWFPPEKAEELSFMLLTSELSFSLLNLCRCPQDCQIRTVCRVMQSWLICKVNLFPCYSQGS